MNHPIKFGTDGWRAVIADDFTFANVRFCAQGAADYLNKKGWPGAGFTSATTAVSPPKILPRPPPKSSPATASMFSSPPKPSPPRLFLSG